jgi:hypothetical protein
VTESADVQVSKTCALESRPDLSSARQRRRTDRSSLVPPDLWHRMVLAARVQLNTVRGRSGGHVVATFVATSAAAGLACVDLDVDAQEGDL